MATAPSEAKRAADYQDLAPLIEHCKAGRLFDVQAWIAEGKPVNPPPIPSKGHRPKSPLEYALDRGFHSLVQVLLEGGAIQEPEGYGSPMHQALGARRFDMVQLLVEHGFDPKTINMDLVFDTWDPQIMDYFIERGAEIQQGHPFASALCKRIRTALGVYKRCHERMPELQEQADIALRHHCKEGNMKWVSLMLWAGADPCKPGTVNPGGVLDEGEKGLSALAYAALYEHYEVFDLKPIRAKLADLEVMDMLPFLTNGKGIDVLKKLLEAGLDPNDNDNGGCSIIRHCLSDMGWYAEHRYRDPWERDQRRGADTERAREELKAIHLLAKHGAKWVPEDTADINSARRSLLRLTADYTIEFVWIMSKYKACTLEAVEQLLRTPSIKAHTVAHRSRLQEILASW